jgi:copper chaperone CopZ
METVKIRIDGIHCAGCLNRIEHLLMHRGVHKFDFDFASRVATIDFDEALTKPLALIHEVNIMGYPARESY